MSLSGRSISNRIRVKKMTDVLTCEDASREEAAERRTASAPVLVAVDFSEEAEAALAWACDYADKVGAPVEILHVVHDPADAPGTYKPDGGDPLEPMVDVAQRKLAKLVERIERGNSDLKGLSGAKTSCLEGLPASVIVELAQTRNARLLVLGGHRRNGLDRLLHGSTAHKVTSVATLPVTIVKAKGK